MKYCEEYAALLDAFAEGDLFTEDMIQVQKHLIECPACQAYVDDLLAIRAAFPTIEDTDVPCDFTAKVMAAVAATPQTKVPAQSKHPAKKKYPWRKTLLPLAACFAIVVLVQGLPTAGNKSAEAMSTAAAPTESAVAYSSTTAESAPAAPQLQTASSKALMDSSEPECTPEASADGFDVSVGSATAFATPVEPWEEVTWEESVFVAGNLPIEDFETDHIATTPNFAVITLSAAEAETLLDSFTPVTDTETHLEYHLSADAFEAFLAALSDKGIVPKGEIHPANASNEVAIVLVAK